MENLFIEYYLKGIEDMKNLPEIRRKKLKEKIKQQDYVRVMEASNGLSGLIVENTKTEGKEYDAMWISSLCDSAFKGMPDNEIVDFTSRLRTIEEILEVTTKPVIVDGDTGGKLEHFVKHINTLERMGVSAIVIEDKKGLKQNSLLGNKVEHTLEEKEVFAEKIRKGKAAQMTEEFMIFARIESFIAGKDMADALERAKCYIQAGADGIMIHSYKKDGQEIAGFLKALKEKHPKVITMVVPTTYAEFREKELQEWGANIIIYANHLLRSAYLAMKKAAEKILEEERAYEAGNEYCVSMEEILGLISEGKK
ncbi:MAG: phosphoenolpyruvate mutase [Lachnospiraceae bacterium]|nr:phosphoenolpyruvate mutase [Lachnospiraceae bacterium]